MKHDHTKKGSNVANRETPLCIVFFSTIKLVVFLLTYSREIYVSDFKGDLTISRSQTRPLSGIFIRLVGYQNQSDFVFVCVVEDHIVLLSATGF